jgi:hypothetical protein
MTATDKVWVPAHDDPGHGAFWLLVVDVNWGRGYVADHFAQLISNVTRKLGGRKHWALLPQELDEDDAGDEHGALAKALPGAPKAGWGTHEPVLTSPGSEIVHEHVAVTMAAGLDLRPPAPAGTGPTRHAVTCVAEFEGIQIGLGNTHPHRNLPIQTVRKARQHGETVFRDELQSVSNYDGGTSLIYGTDANDAHFPPMLPAERSAVHRGLDYIRFREQSHGARLQLMNTGTLQGRIDPHDPLWALFRVSARTA